MTTKYKRQKNKEQSTEGLNNLAKPIFIGASVFLLGIIMIITIPIIVNWLITHSPFAN